MCVVAIAWEAHPRWRLVAAGNRDEFHARASAPLARWDDVPGMVAGRDLVSGGTWMGVSEAGRFAVVTNIRDGDGPDPAKLSRGALVSDWLTAAELPEELGRFNPFNLVVADGGGLRYLANRPDAVDVALPTGIHGLSNAIAGEHWPRTDGLVGAMAEWLEQGTGEAGLLVNVLRDESLPGRDAHPLFINSPVYGTRCSTVITVDHDGQGRIIERRFAADGTPSGENTFDFRWM